MLFRLVKSKTRRHRQKDEEEEEAFLVLQATHALVVAQVCKMLG